MRIKFIFISLVSILSISVLKAVETPTMGWSSWNAFGFEISENIIKSQADALIETGLKDVGYKYVNIDDGYFGGRDKEGKLLIHPTRFPNGLKPLVDYIHENGMKAGIYSDAGKNTCASFWKGDTIGVGVGLLGHDQQDMDFFFKELKFDFIKVDYCGAQTGNNVDNLDLPEQERYTEIYQAIKNTKRRGVRYNICRWAFPGTWVRDIATSWRTTEDIEMSWASIKSIISQSLYLSAYTGDGKYNDMDMLEVGRGLTKEEDKTHFGMWCIMSSPLLIGCDINTITQESLDLMMNEELIALNQDKLGLQAYVVKRENGCYVLVKDIETYAGNKRAIAFYNPTDYYQNVSINFADVDLSGNVQVRDLFEREDMGNFSGSFSVQIPAHGTRIYSLTAETRIPRTLYEAETAWLSAYQELENNQYAETAIYEEGSSYSGGAYVSWLGNSSENDIIWKNVYSEYGGEYTMTLAYFTGENRIVDISVNDEYVTSLSCNSGSWSNVGTKQVTIKLNKGDNIIRLYNNQGWMPNIDYIRVVNNDPTGIEESNINKSLPEYVNVYSINGALIKQNVKRENATDNLANGQYIVGDKVVIVNR